LDQYLEKPFINVHSDLVGSSVFDEEEDRENLVIEERKLDRTTLNKECSQLSKPSILLKIDAQGAERDILEGASELLPNLEVILLEFLFWRNTRGSAIPVKLFLQDGHEYVAYDLTNFTYRPLDKALPKSI